MKWRCLGSKSAPSARQGGGTTHECCLQRRRSQPSQPSTQWRDKEPRINPSIEGDVSNHYLRCCIHRKRASNIALIELNFQHYFFYFYFCRSALADIPNTAHANLGDAGIAAVISGIGIIIAKLCNSHQLLRQTLSISCY